MTASVPSKPNPVMSQDVAPGGVAGEMTNVVLVV
jgi:hypothetical protein